MATKQQTARGEDSRFLPEWETGEHGIPAVRYYDKDFAALEAEKLWPHVWQMACRIEEIPRPGDYTVYDIVDQSILVIRTDEETIKAYHNVCPHRATALAVGSGRFSTGEITCPFHGWRWNIDGDNTFVLDRDEFKGGCLTDEELKLKECQVATWIGCVFINMDPNAISFEEHVAPVKDLLDPILLDQMRFYWHKELVLDGNWKVAQEAFFEAYHVPETHPQIYNREAGPEAYTMQTEYRAYANGHGIFSGAKRRANTKSGLAASAETRQQELEVMIQYQDIFWQGLDAMVLREEVDIARSMRNREIPEDQSIYEAYRDAVYEHYKNQGRPIGAREALDQVGDCHLFPNLTFLPQWGNVLMYRSRPVVGDPDKCIYELWSCKTYPEGETPPRPKVEKCTDGTDPDQYPLIPRQDFSNIPRMQKGFHSLGMKESLLSGRQEVFVSNMHRHLDTYLKA